MVELDVIVRIFTSSAESRNNYRVIYNHPIVIKLYLPQGITNSALILLLEAYTKR